MRASRNTFEIRPSAIALAGLALPPLIAFKALSILVFQPDVSFVLSSLPPAVRKDFLFLIPALKSSTKPFPTPSILLIMSSEISEIGVANNFGRFTAYLEFFVNSTIFALILADIL